MTAPTSAPVAAAHVVDSRDPRWTSAASGVLAEFQAAGVLTAADVHVALRLSCLAEAPDPSVQLATALAVRAARLGSVCLDLTAAPSQIALGEAEALELGLALDQSQRQALPWPDPQVWLAACAASPLVDHGDHAGGRPLQLDGQLLYLDRYWQQEQLVARELTSRVERSAAAPPAVDEPRLASALRRLFPAPTGDEQDRPREAATLAARRWLTVLAGGPGTGKTTTVARILAALADQPGPIPKIALAAPTGKAAARLAEAVREALVELPDQDRERLGELGASTLHRLLGSRPGTKSRFQHHAGNRLPHDIVVLDESSMISLTMMARLLDAVRPEARLILVGDPQQLTPVDAGAVLADIVDAASRAAGESVDTIEYGIVVLTHRWRFGGRIAELASAIEGGDADSVVALLRSPSDDVAFVDADVPAGGADVRRALGALRDDVVSAAGEVIAAARVGDAKEALRQLGGHRFLCAHRHGPYGVERWGDELQSWITAAVGMPWAGADWYAGQPLLITANDYEVRLFNGDTGVVIDDGDNLMAAFGDPSAPSLIRPARLGPVQTMYAATIHRSQGSQFERVSVLLPPEGSPLLTRQLLYTAVTRAKRHVRVIATEAAVRTAVTTPIARASGLRNRLWAASNPAATRPAG